MSLIKFMGEASISRLNGGIIYDYLRAPILKEKLVDHIKNIRNGEGQSRYYHLDEETGLLTRFDKKKNYDYFPLNSRKLTISELRKMSFAYEMLTGYIPEHYRYRVPFTSHDRQF